MLIYDHNKYLKPSYSIKSRNIISTFLMHDRLYIRDGFLPIISSDLHRSDLFIKNDRFMRMDLCICNNNLIDECKFVYQIVTEVNLSFISNHTPFYKIQKSPYFRIGFSKKSFVHPKDSFIGSPIYEKELIIKLGCVGSCLDLNYKKLRTLDHFKGYLKR